MTAGRGLSDNSSATSRRNSGCLTALFLFLINFLKLQESHFSRGLSNKTMTSERYMSWTLCGDSKLTQQMPLPLTPITTSFGMQSISMISIKSRKDLRERFSQQEEISDDDEYANAEEQFSTDPEPEEHSPYSVYQSSFHPKMPQKSFLPRNIWETLYESTKQMIIEHNKKVKLNNPTPYPSGSKT